MRKKIQSKTRERAEKEKYSLYSALKTSGTKGYPQLHMPTRMGLGLFFSDKDYPKLADQRIYCYSAEAQLQLPYFIK